MARPLPCASRSSAATALASLRERILVSGVEGKPMAMRRGVR